MFATIFADRKKKLEVRNVEIQKRADILNKEMQALAKESQANSVRFTQLKELEKEFEKDEKVTLPKG